MSKRAPARSVYHSNWRFGFIANSNRGADIAASKGYPWVDNDYHLTRDLFWVNDHGYPSKVFLGKGPKYEKRPWSSIKTRVKVYLRKKYLLGTAEYRLAHNAQRGVKTEIELKDLRPISRPRRQEALRQLAKFAKAAYGENWQNECQVKMLTSMGEVFALELAEDAHAAGFKTILLVRGKARFKKYPQPYVTYVRGSAIKI